MSTPPPVWYDTPQAMRFARFANGKLVEEWEAADYLGLMQQISDRLE
jgi:hypothetical protein